mmetsp:Transcript_8891/g.24760  ORF Transcript_8891/g.24760 Transcript_8891/m.24760 type:complete len:177 (-) Transcript_8891:1060-1590(-)
MDRMAVAIILAMGRMLQAEVVTVSMGMVMFETLPAVEPTQMLTLITKPRKELDLVVLKALTFLEVPVQAMALVLVMLVATLPRKTRVSKRTPVAQDAKVKAQVEAQVQTAETGRTATPPVETRMQTEGVRPLVLARVSQQAPIGVNGDRSLLLRIVWRTSTTQTWRPSKDVSEKIF